MGIEIDQEEFSEPEYSLFARRLEECLEVLGELLARPGFGAGERSIGAELEVSLVDRDARPLPFNRAVLADTVDPRLTFELNRFNLESNLRHGPLAGAPFAALRRECDEVLGEMRRAAALHEGRVVMIGILPTLAQRDFEGDVMTESKRYRALSKSLRRLRNAPFELDIRGRDVLQVETETVAYEGAATSFQLHLRVEPERFARVYNALQLATPVALAAAGNSPFFLGRELWEETRVALFKQAVDPRRERGFRGAISRVSFGEAWIEHALDLFAENVKCHSPLLPVLADEDPREDCQAGGLPELLELRLHQGTVWRWNRAIYDPAEGGHLRIELRSLPSGPTVSDMLANAAFQLGLGLAVAEEAPEWTARSNFAAVHADFYRAARLGLATSLGWPEALGGSPEPVPAAELALSLLPRAQAGLDAAGVRREDSAPLLATLERRLRRGRSGAIWQRESLAQAGARRPREEALRHVLEDYLRRSEEGIPVDEWEIAS